MSSAAEHFDRIVDEVANGKIPISQEYLQFDQFLQEKWPDQLTKFGVPNNQQQRKAKRAAGQSYKNRRGVVVQAKSVPKPCDCASRKCKLKCTEKISESKRRELCSNYYVLQDYWKQRNYICSMVRLLNVARPSAFAGKRRSYSAKYFFNVGGGHDHDDDAKIIVCRKFFLSTLNVSEKLVRLALREKTSDGIYGGTDHRGRYKRPVAIEHASTIYPMTDMIFHLARHLVEAAEKMKAEAEEEHPLVENGSMIDKSIRLRLSSVSPTEQASLSER